MPIEQTASPDRLTGRPSHTPPMPIGDAYRRYLLEIDIGFQNDSKQRISFLVSLFPCYVSISSK